MKIVILILLIIILLVYLIKYYTNYEYYDNKLIECDHKGIYISSRIDRYAANSIPWINAIMYSLIAKIPLYHQCTDECNKYINNICHKLLIKYSKQRLLCNKCDMHKKEGWITGQIYALMDITNNIPLPDILQKTGFKQICFNAFNNEAIKHKWKLHFNPENAIVIHVRLDDVRNRPHPIKDHQKFIGKDKLIRLMKYLHNKYPTHTMHLITMPNKKDIEICQDIINTSNIKTSILGDNNIDYDLWQMMMSDILIMSHSNYSILAGLFHQGTTVYTYSRWVHFNDIIGAKYKTNNGQNISKVFKSLDFK
jgi:hypothetical protein